MSVQGEITRITNAVSNSYTAVANKGGTVPSSPTVANLPAAINSITGMYQHNKDILTAFKNAVKLSTDYNTLDMHALASQTPANIQMMFNTYGYYWCGNSGIHRENLDAAGFVDVYIADAEYWCKLIPEIDSPKVFCLAVGTTIYASDNPATTLQYVLANKARQ